MADEKKPGLLKRIFSFGLGKKKQAEPEVEIEDNSETEAAAEAAALEAKVAQEAAAQKEADRIAAIKKAEEEALEASRLAAEEAAEKERLEQEAALQKAQDDAEAERLVQEEADRIEAEEEARVEAEAKKRAAEEAKQAERDKAQRIEAERLEQERIQQEELEAKAKADAEEAARLADEKVQQEALLRQAEDEAEAERLAQEADEKERLEAERLEQERLEQERLEAEAEALLQAQDEDVEDLAQDEGVDDLVQDERAEDASAEGKSQDEDENSADEVEALEADVSELPVDEDGAEEPEEERKVGWFKRLTKGLARSSNALTENITSVFTKKKLDEDTLQDLEDILIQADLGVETAMNITYTLASQRMGKDVTDEEVRQVMAEEIEKVLEPVAQPLELDLDHQPHVILVVGVNGSGKTTTIGKISQKLYNAGFSTLLVAGDTFRAAAVEQLHIWGDRTQAPVMSRPNGSDAAGLAFDAYSEAVDLKKDVMLMDTAGRLQNKKELMDELEKIIRVLKKQDENAPHTVLLTLDATTGQNALNQVEIFKDVAGVNGLVMTKLDGTARGGILVSISAKHKLPVYFIGVGEQVEDLEPFEADVFAKAIAGISDE